MAKCDQGCAYTQVKRAAHLVSGCQNTLCDLRLATNTDCMILSDLFQELVLAPCFGEMVDLEALFLERIYGLLADVFEEQQAQVFIFNRVQDLGLPYRVRLVLGLAKTVMEGGLGGRQGETGVQHVGWRPGDGDYVGLCDICSVFRGYRDGRR